jgi:hypothetical protein
MKTCKHCKGTGRVTGPPAYPPKRTDDTYIDCPKCHGTGEGQQMIFWRHDMFPFVLAAPGTLEDDGTAYVPTYQGKFRPIQIMSISEGKELWAQIQALKGEQESVLAAVRAGFHSRLTALVPWVLKNK